MFDRSWEELAAQADYRPRNLATLCKVSMRTLQRHFRGKYGITLGGWLRCHRLTRAYTRISGGETIKSVAYDLGFKQLSHFSRAFKKVHGVTPRLISARSGRGLLSIKIGKSAVASVYDPASQPAHTSVPPLPLAGESGVLSTAIGSLPQVP